MDELTSLLLVLALVYASECLVWVRRGAVLFTVTRRGRAAIRTGRSLLANARGSLLATNLLPPLGLGHLSGPMPVSMSPEHLFAWSSASPGNTPRPDHTGLLLAWEDVLSAGLDVQGRLVTVGDRVLVRATSAAAARNLARTVESLARVKDAGARARAIEACLEQRLDVAGLGRRLEEVAASVRPLRWMGNLLFAYLFLAFPFVILRSGFGTTGLLMLGGMLVQTVPIAWLYRRAHQRLYPEAREERFKQSLTMLLAPPTAIRAADLLGRHVLEGWDPVAVARVLCRPPRFRGFARTVLVDLRHPRHPVCPVVSADAVAAEDWFRARRLAALERFLVGEGIDPGLLDPVPAREEPGAGSYCARCGTQFLVTRGECRDCGGRPLEPFRAGQGGGHGGT